MPKRIPAREDVTNLMPLRLNVAAALAFPDGSMGASGLRREAARGRLVIERIAGKDYTTLQAIEDMRQLCRVQPSLTNTIRAAHGSSAQPGSSATDRGRLALDALLRTVGQISKSSR